jgi:hypothetical protein
MIVREDNCGARIAQFLFPRLMEDAV